MVSSSRMAYNNKVIITWSRGIWAHPYLPPSVTLPLGMKQTIVATSDKKSKEQCFVCSGRYRLMPVRTVTHPARNVLGTEMDNSCTKVLCNERLLPITATRFGYKLVSWYSKILQGFNYFSLLVVVGVELFGFRLRASLAPLVELTSNLSLWLTIHACRVLVEFHHSQWLIRLLYLFRLIDWLIELPPKKWSIKMTPNKKDIF